ncbi:MAG: inositol monophosphatase [Haloarculaceae archaeon]
MADAHRRAAMAERAARAGGTVARQSFRGELRVETKADENDPVTEADRDAQRQAVATVQAEFPGDPVLAEEDALPVGVGDDGDPLVPELPETGDAWVVDPIDGTANFARGVGVWATSVAAVVDREPVASATYVPVAGDVYTAGPESATRDGTTLTVSETDDPGTFLVGLVGRWYPEEADEFGGLCATLTERVGDTRRFGSMQATLAYLADGGLDAVVGPMTHAPWDSLAGVHLVRGAGGTVTDSHGDHWAVDSEGLVASNGRDHEAVVDAVRTGTER